MVPLILRSTDRSINPYVQVHKEGRSLSAHKLTSSQALHAKLLKKHKGHSPICNGIIDLHERSR